MEEHGWLERKLGNWGEFVATHRKSVLLATLFFTLCTIPFAWRAVTNLDVNLFNQASDRLSRFRLMRQLSEDFGGDLVATVITVPDKPAPEQVKELKRFADILSRELQKVGTLPEDQAALPESIRIELQQSRATKQNADTEGTGASPWLRHVEGRTGQGIEQALKKIARDRPHAVLTPEDVTELRRRFEPVALKAALDKAAELLPELPPNSPERVKIQEDPLGLQELAQSALNARRGGGSGKNSLAGRDPDGYFLSPDQTTLVILGRAVLPATRLDFTRTLMSAVQRAENRAIDTFRAGKPTLTTAKKSAVFTELAEPAGALNVGYTGMSAVTVENEMSLKYDLLGNTATAFFGVLVLFLVVFRRVWLAWDVTWTTMLVIIWTLAVAGATKGSISVLGGAFACILLGTGTDYAIHLHNAYHNFRHTEGLPFPQAMRQTLIRCGPGIITASLTTAVAFFGVTFTSFTGLAEFGLLAGASVLLGCAMMLIVFPALLCRPEPVRKTPLPEAASMGLPILGRLFEKRSVQWQSIVVGILVLAGGILFIKYGQDPGPERVAGVRFDPDLGNLRSLRIKAVPLRERLTERFGIGLADIRVVVDAPDEATAFAGAEETAKRLQPFIDRGELIPNGSVLDFVPTPARQAATFAALKQFDGVAAAEAFKAAAQEKFGERAQVFFKPFLKRLHDFSLATREPSAMTLASVMDGPLGGMLAATVRLPQPQDKQPRVRLASSWLPARANFPAAWYNDLAATLETNPPAGTTFQMTAARMVGFEMKDSLLHDCGWISVVVGVCVIAMLLAAFRSAKLSLVALVPLLYGYVGMLFGVALATRLGYEFSLNFVNLIMFPLLLGSGVDVGIYMVCEAWSVRRPGMYELMSDTGRSVLCCTLTTLVGYGSFFWSSYTGLVGLGVAAMFGYTGAIFGALVVLPGIIGLLRDAKAPAAENAGAAGVVSTGQQVSGN